MTKRESTGLPGEARLGIVRTYFNIVGASAVVGTVLFVAIGVAAFRSRDAEWVSRGLRSLAGSVLLAAGCIKTAKLLEERRKTGAWLAIAYFVVGLLASITGSARGLLVPSLSVVGLALIASVWQYLDD